MSPFSPFFFCLSIAKEQAASEKTQKWKKFTTDAGKDYYYNKEVKTCFGDTSPLFTMPSLFLLHFQYSLSLTLSLSYSLSFSLIYHTHV